ncbi:hypothetical protein PENTCL1PPCAC_21831, partial [Pristionchus entomophagus]
TRTVLSLPSSKMTVDNTIIFDKKIDPRQRLRIKAICDKNNWVIEAIPRGTSVSGIVLSARAANPGPAPYQLNVEALRIDCAGRLEHIGSWWFSDELKPGGSFHVRTDAMLEYMSVDDHQKYRYELWVLVWPKRNLRLENLNTAGTAVLAIGDSVYELVSKEILALHSDYFYAFYYGGFAESVSTTECKVKPLVKEDPHDFELAMAMLLCFTHYRKRLSNVTSRDARLLLAVFERFQFNPAFAKHIDEHLVKYCRSTKDFYEWDAALLAADKYNLPETRRHVLPLYKTHHDLGELVNRTRGNHSASLMLSIFDAYRNASLESNYRRCSYAYFSFAAGRVIVQLNRVGLPKTSAVMVDEFSDQPRFYWDSKQRLVSVEKSSRRLFCGEAADKSTIPDGTWALINRILKDGPHYILTKSRPEGNYLGFVVAGDHLLLKGDRCIATGMHQIDG